MSTESELHLERRNRFSFHPLFSSFVLLLFVASVIVPVFGPLELAKWHLAAAKLATVHDDLDRAEKKIQDALSACPNSIGLTDLQLLTAEIFVRRNRPQEALRFAELTAEKTSKSGAALLASRLGEYFFDTGDIANALEALRMARRLKTAPSSTDLNTLSYARAVANVELTEALADIDEAIRREPSEPALLDTKAWVLFRLGKFQEAKPIMEKALQKTLDLLNNNEKGVGRNPEDLQKMLASDSKSQNWEKPLPEEESFRLLMKEASKLPAGERRRLLSRHTFFHIGVLRYHYARILEELNEPEPFHKQWNWLVYYGLTDEELLY